MGFFSILFPKGFYTMIFDLLIAVQPLPVYYFFKQWMYFLTWKFFTLSAKINAMALCAFKQKAVLDTASVMLCTATARARSAAIHLKHAFKITIAFYSTRNMLLIEFFHTI